MSPVHFELSSPCLQVDPGAKAPESTFKHVFPAAYKPTLPINSVACITPRHTNQGEYGNDWCWIYSYQCRSSLMQASYISTSVAKTVQFPTVSMFSLPSISIQAYFLNWIYFLCSSSMTVKFLRWPLCGAATGCTQINNHEFLLHLALC